MGSSSEMTDLSILTMPLPFCAATRLDLLLYPHPLVGTDLFQMFPKLAA